MDDTSVSGPGKILFVCSGTPQGRCTPAIEQQAKALMKHGVEVVFFRIKGRGLRAYLLSIFKLRRYLGRNKTDLVHAHYGLSGMVARLAGARPLVVSLMGSDVFGPGWLFRAARFFTRYLWPVTIVKSREMAKKVGENKVLVIPNGVDMELFRELPRELAKSRLKFNDSPLILWPANPQRAVKNVDLAIKVAERLMCDLKMVWDIPTEQMVWYYNAADVVLITSKWEGSPNVVKEALACNVPVVATDVGDIKHWVSKVEGCFAGPPDAEKLALLVEKALAYKGRVNGRDKIKELDIKIINNRLMDVYTAALNKGLQKTG